MNLDEPNSNFAFLSVNNTQNHTMDTGFNLFDYYHLTRQREVMIAYKGPITDVIMSEISRDIRTKFVNVPKIGRKIFSIFIELAQNILYYSAEEVRFGDYVDRVGGIILLEYNDHYALACGNLVENSNVQDLVGNCHKINSLDRDSLREYKREQRIKPSSEKSKGAGIGLIHVAITAESPLEINVQELDEQFSFFSLTVKIYK